jgi:phosphopantothenoylcysteine decarboxylase / phosphopantothenate---cysteine ligase
MVRIMITSGPTRQYLDPVRYLTNGSSGRMGRSLAQAALELGYQVVIITGPVEIEYPTRAEVVPVISTEELLEACQRTFPTCDGMIAAAAPCDYRPIRVAAQKISKTGVPLELQMVETPDVVAALGATKRIDQWIVGFALETEDQRLRALAKLEKKSCDLMVLNGPEAMNSKRNQVEIIDRRGNLIDALAGPKEEVARGILQVVGKRLIEPRRSRFELVKERGAAVSG